MTENIKSAYCF